MQFIVAPYEADVQLAYLSINGRVDAVVTEDSDLVVYGAKRIFLKMDKHGAGQLFCQSSLVRLNIKISTASSKLFHEK